MTDRRRFFSRCAGLAATGLTVQAAPALAQGTVTEGIDVSHWQGTINWPNVAAAGLKFAVCKATEGTTYLDPQFAANYAGIKNNGMVRGAYHMGRSNEDPIRQARFVYDTVKPASGDLPIALDVERDDGMTPTQYRYWIQRFCTEIKRKMGKPPLIYVGYYFWRDQAGGVINSNVAGDYDSLLWMPRWNVSSPLPLAQSWTEWTFWQYSSTGNIGGLNPVDRDQFNGSLSALQGIGMP